MAEGFLADVAATSLSSLVSAVVDPLVHAWGHQDDVNNLKKRVRLAQAFLSDAMMSTSAVANSQAGKVWLEDFTDVVRNAESVLAVVDYQLLCRKIQKHYKVRSKLGSFIRGFRLTQKIKDISASFDEIHTRGCEIGLNPSERATAHQSNCTARFCQMPPTVDEAQVVGREGDVCELVRRLCCSSASSSSSGSSSNTGDLSGGVGKTTLAQLLWQHKEIIKNFGERIWVTVSEPFYTVTMLNEMLQSLTRKNNDGLTNIPAEGLLTVGPYSDKETCGQLLQQIGREKNQKFFGRNF